MIVILALTTIYAQIGGEMIGRHEASGEIRTTEEQTIRTTGTDNTDRVRVQEINRATTISYRVVDESCRSDSRVNNSTEASTELIKTARGYEASTPGSKGVSYEIGTLEQESASDARADEGVQAIDGTEYGEGETAGIVVLESSDSVSNDSSSDSLVYLGTYKLTAYCSCKECCGKEPTDPWYGITATGSKVQDNFTIAVDPAVIPLGSYVQINGTVYHAEDTGKSIKGNIIDIYISDHETTKQFGVQYADVYLR